VALSERTRGVEVAGGRFQVGRSRPLKVLLLEESDSDSALLARELRRGGYAADIDRVRRVAELRAATNREAWDVVLVGSAPGEDALPAVDAAVDASSEVPVIVLSAAEDEAAAATVMRAGARDYVLKSNLARLVPAIERELMKSEERAAQRREQAAVAEKLAQAERMRVGIEMVAALSASLEPARVFDTLIEQVTKSADAEGGAFVRIEDRSLVVEAGHGLDRMVPIGSRWDAHLQPLVNEALVKRTPVFDGSFEPLALPEAVPEAVRVVRHALAVPFLVGDDVYGILVLARSRETPFNAGDVAIVQIIGSVAMLALRNARLFSEAEAASRAKSEFLNMAAHELRTPLTVIRGYMSMLQEGALGTPPEIWIRPIDQVALKTEELSAMVEDILAAARLEAGAVATRRSRADLRGLVREAVGRAGPRASLRGAELSVHLPAEDVEVEVDVDHVGRILDKLLINALTYSDDRPRVQVSVAAADEAEVVIEDFGVGIPEEMHERVFHRFFRIENPKREYQPGTGLGLYLARQLAERTQGTLLLERSVPGAGSTFVLRLPTPPPRAGEDQGGGSVSAQ
jgi:signal transduction histidine kinase/DNA-binding NarL/FixJ family response regulator